MIQCLYVASPSYSGSTLLSMLLGRHPRIATVGEMKGGQEDLATYRCSCGDLLRSCPFWTRLVDDLRHAGFEYNLADRRTMPAFRAPLSRVANALLTRPFGGRTFEMCRDALITSQPAYHRRLKRLLRYNETFIKLVLKQTGANVFLDSSKDPVRIKYLTKIPSMNVSVIQLVRDGRAVVRSARKNSGLDTAAAAKDWLSTHYEIQRVAGRCCSGRLLRIRYEDLCADPNGTVRRVLRFASLEDDIDATRVDATGVHVLGNRMRLMGSQSIRLDEAWRTDLSNAELRVFEHVAGPLNRHFGYDESVVLGGGADAHPVQHAKGMS